jgi:hypothetical protein
MSDAGEKRKAGRPKGTTGIPHKATIDKALAREVVRGYLEKHMPRMVSAQVESSCGLAHLMLRNEDGTWAKAPVGMTEDQMLAVLNGDPTRNMISLKDPNTQAFNTLAAYYLDKPKEQEQELKLTGDADLIAALMAGRQRAAKAKGEK